jgi:ABC-type transporter Mla subunit MlaD
MKNAGTNFIVGLWTLAGLAGGMFLLLSLSGVSWLTERRAEYTVRFTVNEGAAGLKRGSVVRIGGQDVGVVSGVSYKNDEQAAPQFVDVGVSIRREIPLFKDATVQLELPLLGSVSLINIPSVGTLAAGKLSEGEIIEGNIAPPAFLAQAGYGDKQRQELQSIFEDGAKIASNIQSTTSSLSAKLDNTLATVDTLAGDVRTATTDIRTRLDTWSPKIDSVLTNAQTFTGNLETSRRGADELIQTARQGVSDVRELLAANRPRIDASAKNIEELTAKLNAQLLSDVQAVLADARKGLASFEEAGTRVNALVAENQPEIRMIMANARLASDQLKLTMTEIRRNPWRVLYQPGKKELEQELLYDAARTYADAVSDLRAASASIEAAATAGTTNLDAARIQGELQSALDRYRQAEREFLAKLLEERPAPKR